LLVQDHGLPNRGRYIFTLISHPEAGFRKAGEVRGTSLRFTAGPDNVIITSSKPIVSSDAAFNLYTSSWTHRGRATALE
jgi:hypothetical protein